MSSILSSEPLDGPSLNALRVNLGGMRAGSETAVLR